jgi:hypothetical protein
MIFRYLLLIPVLVLFCCSSKKAIDADNLIDSTALVWSRYDTTFTFGKRSYHIQGLPDGSFCMVDLKGDTLIREYGVHGFEFDNVDDDSLADLRIHYVTNVPDIEDVFLADGSTYSFQKIESFSDFPAWSRLKGTPYYYSYHRSGCADSNWDSDLFYIKDFKTYCVGNIAGRECGDTDPKDGIYISTVWGDSTSLIETLPINTISAYKDYKWGFIEDYWTKHYKRFTAAMGK